MSSKPKFRTIERNRNRSLRYRGSLRDLNSEAYSANAPAGRATRPSPVLSATRRPEPQR